MRRSHSTIIKWLMVATILTLCGHIPDVSASTKKFMVGPYQGLMGIGVPGPGNLCPGQTLDAADLHHYLALWIDTMKSSWAWDDLANYARADSFMARHFKLYAADSATVPGHRGDLARERYVVWQTDPASVPPWFADGWTWGPGRSVIDQGTTSWHASHSLGDTAGWVLRGPWCYDRSKLDQERQAIFRIRIANVASLDTAAILYAKYFKGGNRDDPANYEEMKRRVIMGSTNGYDTLTLAWPDHADSQQYICYPVYWYGNGDLYIDSITAQTATGYQIAQGNFDHQIKLKTAPLTYGSGDSVVKAWFLNDESVRLENFPVVRKIESALLDTTGHAPASPVWPVPFWAYIKMVEPKYLVWEVYPFVGGTAYSSEYTGSDSSHLQEQLTWSGTDALRWVRRLCDTTGQGTQLIINTQTFRGVTDCHERWRYPTGYEGTCLANLCLAYGVDGLIYWKGLTWGDSCNTLAGLLDVECRRTPLFDSMAAHFAPFVDSLGDLFYDLKWINANESKEVDTIAGSFITSVQSTTFPANPYVEVAFFKDTVTNDDYFMLVNRRCLASESQQVRAVLNRPQGMYYIVDQYSRDTVLTGTMPNGTVPFTTSLGPGHGKLFKIIPAPAYVSGSSLPATWQGGIRVGGNVTMAAGRTWKILPPARIRVDTVGNYAIDVYGSLIAEGTVFDTIHFVSNSASPHANDWYGIRVRGAGDVTATYADFSDAYKGLWLWNTADTITATIDHCSFIQHYLAGVAFEANAASAISVRHSTFDSSRYYGVWIPRGKVDVDSNHFFHTGCNGVRIDGSSQSVTGGHIRDNLFTGWEWPTSIGVVLHIVRDDGLDWRNENLLQGNVFTGWTGENQTGIQVLTCPDTLRFLRNAIIGNSWKPGFGILNNRTRILVTGDLTMPESVSAIWGTRYGIYSFAGSPNSQNYPIVRKCSFESAYLSVDNSYDIWVSDVARIDLGRASEFGYNVFHQYCGWLDWVKYAVYNTNPSDTVKAVGNYWTRVSSLLDGPLLVGGDGGYGFAGAPPPTYCTSGLVDHSLGLGSNPFAGGGYSKVVADRAAREPATTEFGRLSNYPNPFNSATVLHFSLSDPGLAEVAVYNVLGQKVKTVCRDNRSAGEHQVIWDGRDEQSRPVSSGVYFYTVTSGGKRLSKSIVLLK